MLAIGTVLHQKYRIEHVLGRGGMGDVYLASAPHLSDMVAIKEVHPVGSTPDIQEAALQQFRQEAQLLKKLKHRLLPKLYDYFELDRNAYMVMEYIMGRSLDSVMMAEEESLPVPMVMGWAADLCDVLDYLHTHDPMVVYRDLKPANIMLDVNGRIRLIDFGISKTVDKVNPQLTSTFARGAISPGFTAPEQYAGGTDPRTDIYSLGATLYALLTRTSPPSGVERAADIVSLVPLRTFRPEVSDEVADGIEKLMMVRSADRPPTIEEVRVLLGLPSRRARPTSELTDDPLPEPEPLVPDEPAPPRTPVAPAEPRRPKSAPRPWIGGAISLVALVLALLLWPAFHHASPEAPASTPPEPAQESPSAAPHPTRVAVVPPHHGRKPKHRPAHKPHKAKRSATAPPVATGPSPEPTSHPGSLAVLLALGATTLFNIGMGLQKRGAGAWSRGLKGALHPAAREDLRWWLAGSGVMLPALLLQILALRTGTATLVAILDGFGLVVLTGFSALILREVVGAWEVGGMALTIAGVGVGGYVQTHLSDAATVHWETLLAGAGALLFLSLGGAAWRWREEESYGLWFGLAAGFLGGFAVLAIRLGFVLDEQAEAALVWGGLTLACFVLNQIAYQQGRAVEIVPAFTAGAILGPVLLGPLGLGEAVSPLTGVAVLLLVGGLAAITVSQIREENARHWGVVAVSRPS